MVRVERTVAGCSASRFAGTEEYEAEIYYDENRQAKDLLLHFTWAGDQMEVYAHGKKINDYFYTNGEDILSLRYFDYPERLRIIVYALWEETPIFLEHKPQFTYEDDHGNQTPACTNIENVSDAAKPARKGRACGLTEVRPEALFW